MKSDLVTITLTLLAAGCVRPEIVSRLVLVSPSDQYAAKSDLKTTIGVRCAIKCLRRPLCMHITISTYCFFNEFGTRLLFREISYNAYAMDSVTCAPTFGCYYVIGAATSTFGETEEICESSTNGTIGSTVYRSRLLSIRGRLDNSAATLIVASVGASTVALGLSQDADLRWRWSDGSPVTFTFFDGVVGDGSQMPTTNVQGMTGRSYAVMIGSGDRRGQWQSYSMDHRQEKSIYCVITLE